MKSVSVEKENVNIKSLIRKAWNGVKETIATLNDLVGPTPVGGGSDSRVKAEVSKVENSQSPRIPQLEGLFDYSKNAKVAEKENRPKEKKRKNEYSEIRTEVTKSDIAKKEMKTPKSRIDDREL